MMSLRNIFVMLSVCSITHHLSIDTYIHLLIVDYNY